jgi:hypothetical protein
MELENIIFSWTDSEKKRLHVFSRMWNIGLKQLISNIVYTYKYIQSMYPEVELVKEKKSRRRKRRKER